MHLYTTDSHCKSTIPMATLGIIPKGLWTTQNGLKHSLGGFVQPPVDVLGAAPCDSIVLFEHLRMDHTEAAGSHQPHVDLPCRER